METPQSAAMHEKEIKETEIGAIKDFVELYRNENNIPLPTNTNMRPELSCIGYPGGEFANLIETQLAHTAFGYGAWRELEDAGVRSGVLAYIQGLKRVLRAPTDA